MERKYYLYEEETTLEHIMEYLEDFMQNGNPNILEDIGITAEDVEIGEE